MWGPHPMKWVHVSKERERERDRRDVLEDLNLQSEGHVVVSSSGCMGPHPLLCITGQFLTDFVGQRKLCVWAWAHIITPPLAHFDSAFFSHCQQLSLLSVRVCGISGSNATNIAIYSNKINNSDADFNFSLFFFLPIPGRVENNHSDGKIVPYNTIIFLNLELEILVKSNGISNISSTIAFIF